MQTHKRSMNTITILRKRIEFWKNERMARERERQKKKHWNFSEYQFPFLGLTLLLISYFILLDLVIARVPYARFDHTFGHFVCKLCDAYVDDDVYALQYVLADDWTLKKLFFFLNIQFLSSFIVAMCSMFNVFDISFFILGAKTLLICRTTDGVRMCVCVRERQRMVWVCSRRDIVDQGLQMPVSDMFVHKMEK